MPNMSPVSASELASIQSDLIAAVCDKACLIYRHTGEANDPYGSQTPTYMLINTTVAGMAQPSAGELANYDYVIGDKAAWTVHLPINTDVTHQDHLVVEGQTLEVHILLTPKSYPGLTSVIAAEIK